ncbi:prephenate dehydrogenase [Paenibacillus koleovorans]|uniref:prephenate dehydrogenase n=1 Tax=Paenibacillus koleovorans TaxID=121608 RepID=UPI000FDA842C|nr:prephenate dehydrogenase [Paenibacillus koleovorans]
MTTITLFGVGLMGGSLGLCFKGKPGLEVIGYTSDPIKADKYIKRGVVDRAVTSMQEAAEAADFIFICLPVGMLEGHLKKLAQYKLKPGCIVTDVGSTKASIAECAEQLDLGGAYFIGGHPMAGSERSGVEAASSHLYENAFYVLTPSRSTPEEAYERLVALLRHTKAHIIRVDAREHDLIAGAISHLPHIIAVALVNQVAGYNESNPLYENLAAGGFRDITRIASSHPEMWRDILLNNRDVMLRLLKDWQAAVQSFEALIEGSDGDGIEEQFQRASKFRSQLPERRKGIITAIFDLYVDVPDHPGIIGQIASLLGNHRINLSNMHIIESRADVPGVLRLSFRTQPELDAAAELLKANGHEVRF